MGGADPVMHFTDQRIGSAPLSSDIALIQHILFLYYRTRFHPTEESAKWADCRGGIG
jgi:hypothetical protein